MPAGALVEADTQLRQLLENLLVENKRQTRILARLLSLSFPSESVPELTTDLGEGGTI